MKNKRKHPSDISLCAEKRRKKWKRVTLTAVLIFVLASSVSVLAEDRQRASGWQVTFDGKKLESNFTSADMSNEANAMQPGDSVEFTVTVKNTFDGQADWYMKNEVLQSLEDAGDAAGGAYDYLLTYTDTAGQTTTLYSSEKFGGEGKINGVGLHGATQTLQNYFYLDRMGNGESGTVKLKVALDGETLVNDYQNTLARLQMDFATELVSGTGTGTPNSPGGPGGGDGGGSSRTAVKTGDDTKIMGYLVMMFVSGLVLLTGAVILFHRQQEEEAEGGAKTV